MIEDAEKIQNVTAEVAEKAEEVFGDLGDGNKDNAETVWESVEKEAKELVEVAKEVAQEIWDDIKGIFGDGTKSKPKSDEVAANRTARANSTSIRTKRHRMAVNFVY